MKAIFSTALFCVSACLPSLANAEDELLVPRSEEERRSLLDNADVWRPFDPTKIDMWEGPDTKFRTRGDVSCVFEEFSSYWDVNPLNGKTNKFRCLYTNHKGETDSIKVKYGNDYRAIFAGHVYGEIASSRLLWALGFGADRMYPVRLQCQNCPRDPWEYHNKGDLGYISPLALQTMNEFERNNYNRVAQRGDWIFMPAAIEKKFKGVEIGLFEKQGWGFGEFMNYKNVSRERAIHRDALTLLVGGMLHHADNKAENQRLVCLEKGVIKSSTGEPIGCTKPFALVHDLGWTWGGGFGFDIPGKVSKMNLEHWKITPIFKGKTGCTINTRAAVIITNPSLRDVEVSEEGRLFLLGLLKNLDKGKTMTLPMDDGAFEMTTTMQLFFASYVDLADIYAGKARGMTAEQNIKHSVMQWYDAFQNKIRELESRTCPKHLN